VTRGRWVALAIFAALIAAFFALGLQRYFTLENFKAQQAAIEAYRSANPLAAAAIFFAIYVVVTGLSLPGAGILTVVGGAIFGFVQGVVIVSFASTIGATIAFLIARFLLHDAIQSRFGERLKPINEGVKRDGGFYLFTIRLVPAFPFFIVNVLMALTPIRTPTFYWVSQLGMLPFTLVFVNAGTQLAHLTSLRGILSPGLLGAFVMLGVFPLIARKIIETVKRRRGKDDAPRGTEEV
jgi:uncharacterized membrane protein YdjX (TVP38/TMEM64 family)